MLIETTSHLRIHRMIDPGGHRTGAEVDDRIGNADRHHLGVGCSAEKVVEPAGEAHAPAREECRCRGPVARLVPREVAAGVGGVLGIAAREVPPQVGAQMERERFVGGVVAGVQNADANPAAGRIADLLARGLEAGVIGVQVPADRGRADRPVPIGCLFGTWGRGERFWHRSTSRSWGNSCTKSGSA